MYCSILVAYMSVKKAVKKILPAGILKQVNPAGHLVESVLLHAVNGFPAKNLKVIGVTGTNGKTTTSFMIHRMLTDAGYKTGLMTTAAYGIDDDIRPQLDHMTNVPVREFIKRLKWMKSEGVEWLVLETTSHALVQHRVWGVPYTIVALTNVTHEHLDYHGTFEAYRDAKRKLFKIADKVKDSKRIGIINADDPSAKLFAGDIKHPITYGIENGDLRAQDIKLTSGGSRYKAKYQGRELRIECHVAGRFNVYNSLAAAAVGGAVGLTKEEIEKGIAAVSGVAGRMEAIDAGQDYGVVVDFAHTPDALEKLLASLKEVAKGKVKLVFGATGDRDKSKRPEMGRMAAKYADEIYLTDDETYTEDPQAIIDEVFAGIKEAGGEAKTKIINDRREAITEAFKSSGKGDIVALAGIGSENYRNMGGKAVPWDEREIAREIIGSLK